MVLVFERSNETHCQNSIVIVTWKARPMALSTYKIHDKLQEIV